MRKASFILGIIALALMTLATILKIIKFPGGSFLILTSVLPLMIFQLLLLMLALKQNASSQGKTSAIMVFFGCWLLSTGLLFVCLNWKGSIGMLVLGAIAFAAALVLFFSFANKNPEAIAPYRKQYILIPLYFVLFFVCAGLRWNQNAINHEAQLHYFSQLDDFTKKEQECAVLIQQMQSIPLDDSTKEVANDLLTKTYKLLDILRADKLELLQWANHTIIRDSADIPGIPDSRLDDVDLGTHLMEGGNPEEPCFRGQQLLHALQDYKMTAEQTTTSFDCDLPQKPSEEADWFRRQFHHQPLITVFSHLCDFEIAVCQAQISYFRRFIPES